MSTPSSDLRAFVSLWFNRLRAFPRRSRLDREMDEEMRTHIEEQTRRNVIAGMPLAEAVRDARRRFGWTTRIREEARDQRGITTMETCLKEIRFAARMLRRSPGFTVIAVITLALGIGLNTSMFSVVNRMLMRPLPFPSSEQLVRVFGTSPQSKALTFSTPDAEALREQVKSFANSGLFAMWSATFNEAGRPPEYSMALRVSWDFLPTLGVKPLHGRWFTAEEDQPGSNVVMLPHVTWMRLYAGDPHVVGRTIRVDSTPMQVIGILPKEFDASVLFGPVGIVRPLAIQPWEKSNRDQCWLHFAGRLAPGATVSSAEAELRSIAARLALEFPKQNQQTSVRVTTLHASATIDTVRSLTFVVLGLSGFVLLIACVNLANLQLVRATARSRESAIRLALGASRGNLMRPLVWESLLLALVGGGAGLAIAWSCNAWMSSGFVLWEGAQFDLPIDWRVLGFAAFVAVLTGLLFGTAPGWLASRVHMNEALKQQSRGSTSGRVHGRVRQILVVGEFALALALLAGAGFFLSGLDRFVNRNPGWNTGDIAFGSVALPATRYSEPEKSYAFYRDVRDRLGTMPGVDKVAVGWSLPMWAYLNTRSIAVDGRGAEANAAPPVSFFNAVFPGYFEALQIPLVNGRLFSDRDDQDAPRTAIINQTMARTLFAGEDPIGQRLGIGPEGAERKWLEIVGVVRDVGFSSNPSAPASRFQVYIPFAQEPWSFAAVAVRTSLPAETMIETLRRAVAEVDGDVAVADPMTVRGSTQRAWANFGLIIRLLAGFATLGLFLAALGIYGVIAQTVAQRTQEIGVRLALGAQVRDVVWMMLGAGLRLTAAGAVLGIGAAFAVGRLLLAVSPEMRAPTMLITTLVTAALVLVAIVASFLPARRATRVNPVIALRAE